MATSGSTTGHSSIRTRLTHREPIDWMFLLASFEGRIPRAAFWTGLGALAGVGAGVGLLLFAGAWLSPAAAPALAIAGWGLAATLVFPLAALATKRWHDRNKSGCRSLVVVIPVAGLLYLIYELGFVPGMSERFAARRACAAA